MDSPSQEQRLAGLLIQKSYVMRRQPVSFRRDFKDTEVLNWITILGCSMSIIGLSLTITFQMVTRKSRKTNPTVLLMSLCMCLLIFTLLFMLGVDNPHKQLGKPEIQEDNILPPSDKHTEQDRGPCTAVAVLLQCFLLGTFTWNTLYATHVFLMIRNSLATSPSHFTAYTVAIGWVAGLLPSIQRRELWLQAANVLGAF
ncbi:adhesion G-protein coupled receptor G7-like isoform X2 [Oncorhynchus masou masou]|uniref:adhesion G-protein coupled receptor G7-like isoform X2 n=1 Tax=Oncorhynchus masou masou TaxID=90313 RepID=UPI0031845104